MSEYDNKSVDPIELCRAIRRHAGLTQEQLAGQLKVTVSSVNRWENRKTRPGGLARESILRLAESLGVGVGA